VTVVDGPGTGMGFSIEFLSNAPAAPWTCTFNANQTSATCTHPGPIAAGNSVSLPISFIATTPGRYENCADVTSYAGSDPDMSNNHDCTCADFKRCRDIAIDISTGTYNGTQLLAGTLDDDWKVVSTPGGLAGNVPANVVGPFHTGFLTLAPANWISTTSSQQSLPSGDYVYQLKYNTGPERFASCIIAMQYASDNEVFFDIDGSPLAQNTDNTSHAFTDPHSRTWFAPSGSHTLRARVHNDSGPTSLLVNGSVLCYCFIVVDPIPIKY
jgi:hypothetical protein